ncbi:MAG: putative tryptophan/tyrosine transport system substrate-binding protein [Candidatus Dependentiae bacterium]|nr:putative tryptophan/tyrosine transport system substrate-binding protein [Candidatus Dependentiae bacterium]
MKKQNAATRLFNQVLSLVTEVSSFYAHQASTHEPSLGSKVRGLILSSTENREWTYTSRERFIAEFGTAYPDTELELTTIYLNGNEFEMYSALLSHPAIAGEDKGRFSFVITPGYIETELMAEIREVLNLNLIQLYAVPGSMTIPFLKPRRGLAGVHNTPMAATEYANGLRGLMPAIKKVCLAYTPDREQASENDSLKAQRRFVLLALARKGIRVVEHLWNFNHLYSDDLRTHLAWADALITLDEPAVSRHRAEIVALCDQEKTLFCSSDLDSVFKGAGIGCGVTKEAYVRPMIVVLHNLLTTDGYVKSYQIPKQVGLRYNWEAMLRQGLKLPDHIVALMQMKSVYDADIIRIDEE